MNRTPRVVIVGGGFAGVAAAKALQPAAAKGLLRIVLVNRENFMLFTPMLPEVAAGSIEARHVAQPLRALLDNELVDFELGEVVSIDAARRTLAVRHPLTHESRALDYDELVLALGAASSTMGVPGVEKFAVPLKTLADAQAIRNRVVGALEVAVQTKDLLERDRLLRFTIVGADFTGVELAGELRGFVRSVLHYYPAIDPAKVEIVLVESGERLLSHLPSKFGKYAAWNLRKRGVRLMVGAPVDSVDPRGVQLRTGERISSATVFWSAGEEPSPLARQMGLKTDRNGAIRTRGDLSVEGSPHVWALGDCAAVPRPDGGTYAPLAQNAIREGKLLASNLLAALRARPTRNFRYREIGQMASLGDRQAVAEIPGGRMLAGLPAWLAWRTYYLGRLPGWNRKARVALDWTLGLAFPPETARLPMVEDGRRAAS